MFLFYTSLVQYVSCWSTKYLQNLNAEKRETATKLFKVTAYFCNAILRSIKRACWCGSLHTCRVGFSNVSIWRRTRQRRSCTTRRRGASTRACSCSGRSALSTGTLHRESHRYAIVIRTPISTSLSPCNDAILQRTYVMLVLYTPLTAEKPLHTSV